MKSLTYNVRFAGHTDVGKKRDHNEDAYFFDPERYLAIVADGMGGHQAGEVASAIIVDTFRQGVPEEDSMNPGDYLRALFEASNKAIYDESQRNAKAQGMGSTATALLFSPRGYHAVNVGDSRTYLLRHGELRQVTKDHSFVQLQVQMGLLTEEDSRHSRLRHILTKSVGGHPTIEADLYEDAVASRDLFLLCTDGFYQGFSHEEVEEMLREETDDLEALARHLVEQANERDGSDNITVLLARVE